MPQQISSDTLTVLINTPGAELCSIRDRQGLEYLWQGNSAVWPRHAPVLFPIVGRLKNNSFRFGEASYSLSQHGFARDLAFDLTEKSHKACTFELRANAETKRHYPFEFIFRIGYALEGRRLTTSYSVMNPAQELLLFSVGAHPGFNCPLLPEERFEDYYLEFERPLLHCTELAEGLRSDAKQPLRLQDRRLFLSGNLFDRDALVFEGGQVERVSLCSSRSPHRITMECPGWPYFGIWSKKGSREFVCLEPWFGVADHVEHNGHLPQKDGIISLAPGKEFSCSFSVILD